MAKEFFTKDQLVFEEHPTRKSFLDLTGKVIDKLTVIGFYGWNEKGSQFWWCECSCEDGKYFKVNATSLKKNVTKSCGCNYKNNGKRGSYEVDSKSVASGRLSEHLTFESYEGWNYPCAISCKLCHKVTSFSKANNARGFQCCKDSVFDTLDTNLNKYNYSYLGNGVASCNSCGLEQKQQNVKDFCGCNNLPESKEPCAVYFLQEEANPWIKIGKGLLPEDRRYNINRSAKSVGYSFPVVSKQVWVDGEKAAYRLEGMLHRFFKDSKVTLPKFDGYDEVFKVTLEDCEKYLDDNKTVIDKVVLKDYTPPLKIQLTEHTINQSIEWCGSWYRSRAHLLVVEDYTLSEFELIKDYTCKTKAHHRILWRRSASKYDLERSSEKLYGKDWGDGLFGTIHGLARKYGQCDGAIWHRVNVLNYTMQYALSLPRDSTDKYWYINGKWHNKRELCKSIGERQATVTQRMHKGTPFMYAIIPDRWKITQIKDRIYILNGEAYWFADLKFMFGFSESPSTMFNRGFAGVQHYLEFWCFITEDDKFEEITW